MSGGLLPRGARSVAIVGASPSNRWTAWALTNLRAYKFPGAIYAVNPNRPDSLGLPTFESVDALPACPDVAIVALNARSCVEAVEQCARRGTQTIVVVSDGFAEIGKIGALLQQELVDACRRYGTRLIGPNTVGFADFALQLAAIAEPIPLTVHAGDVSVISQSGGLLSGLMDAMTTAGHGLDLCISIGNAADVDVVDAVAATIERPTTRYVCAFIESLGRDIAGLAAQMDRARSMGKQVLVTKAAGTDATLGLALSHTASIAHEDRLVDVFLREHGVMRAADLDEMVSTTSVLRLTNGRPLNGGVAIVATSGGAAGLGADLAKSHGARLAVLSRKTRARLRVVSPKGAFLGNPIDLTARSGDQLEESYRAIYSDPAVALVVHPWSVTWPDESEARSNHRAMFELQRGISEATGVPTIIVAAADLRPTTWSRSVAVGCERFTLLGDLACTMRAIAHVLPEDLSVIRPSSSAQAGRFSEGGALNEVEGRAILEACGFPVVRGRWCASLQEVNSEAEALRPPLAVKIVADGVSHKSRIGGVRLGCRTPSEIRSAAEGVFKAAVESGAGEAVRGVLLTEMVWGTEIIVGLRRSDAFGAVVTVGLGGATTELADVAASAFLPLTPTGLRGLIDRARIRAVVPRSVEDPLVRLLRELCRAFISGELTHFDTVELNPVVLTHGGPVVVDILMVPAAARVT